ncbi:UDP-N-acetylmuramoyl-L-alanyl-D-glutamate--2,6-diaminopimelate ligase [Arthrobacter sp. SLBN-112]|uniref:UDP-N-acetylmuramoyl-L-alanyl-D-glutamate--2, 6-diaminopimelate ligase n=1 Tax=Arthrobacter sp. SLBN-112 TaxID=2768452 RepID=UPI0027B3C301|nr:UDP-N-acetylmuramoyl-L-alanyl-D-glutamate--2,6-diaminopimelate ligase [Arthrobacter sp. SLBN-112]MDQ0801643.1 UDP-N-acetylmuramoyl-L-alanyl-D-glutamate--2,6-diaminopimelate ligase [Arthrobacter sp. SLBN-112]
MSEFTTPGGDAARDESPGRFRPTAVAAVPLAAVGKAIGVAVPAPAAEVEVTGISINSRTVEPGDLYVALPGASRHGADFVTDAIGAGAAAVLTDDAGARLLALAAETSVPVLVVDSPRNKVGPLSALIYRSQSSDGRPLQLLGVTGTNGKTTTTYFITSLLRALGRQAGLIGTIEIQAGGEPIPSLLTTPESPEVHGLLALMHERGLDAAAMEVSSHAISYQRVDGLLFDVAGFTNLTQDHLDLHHSMDGYFATKAELFTPGRARRAVVTVDDEWGRQLAGNAQVPVTTLSTGGHTPADWTVTASSPRGLGTDFTLTGPAGAVLNVHTGLPGGFNVANAALAALMVLTSGVDAAVLQDALDRADPFTVAVPGRMQLISDRPAAVVDFAHNTDALARALEAVRSPEPDSRLIVVFGATGQRDQGKRPAMGAIAARLADTVIITDDDPHDEDAAAIRADVLAGAREAVQKESLDAELMEVFPRAEAIRRAAELARPQDTILVAGRGHEVWQEVKGVNLALDDRVELRSALTARGFNVLHDHRIES